MDRCGCEIVDYPRFAHRGAHPDVARHFFTVEEVKAFVDQVAPYKMNYLHLHLTDNKGWRLQIDRLAGTHRARCTDGHRCR